jgi:quinol monooxygenase YgiN
MLLIEGWIKLGAGEFAKVRDAGIAMVKATNEEAGCLHYAFAQDIADPDLIRISERWESARSAFGQRAYGRVQQGDGRGKARRGRPVALQRRSVTQAALTLRRKTVIASVAKQSRAFCASLDCFAPLAMTWKLDPAVPLIAAGIFPVPAAAAV